MITVPQCGGNRADTLGTLKMTLAKHEYEQALIALNSTAVSVLDKIDMLMHIATRLQNKPQNPDQLLDAADLYDRALAICPEDEYVIASRLHAGKASALQMYPGESTEFLERARAEFNRALMKLEHCDLVEEKARIHMNSGLLIQSLSAAGKARIADAIDHYQKALRVFTKDTYPREFAILHNNLATAYLSISAGAPQSVTEALAVQSFQAALEVTTLEDSPNEYAMLQNNLGNALQYVQSEHWLQNNLQALKAYDEALKVRTPTTTPLLYANTISNKANCLSNLPDDVNQPEQGNLGNLRQAIRLYDEAKNIFDVHAEHDKVRLLEEMLEELHSRVSADRSAAAGNPASEV